MKFEDFKWLHGNNKFRTEFRITLIDADNKWWKVGFNSEAKAKAAMEFLQNLCETDAQFVSVSMKRVPRVKGRISYSQAKKRGMSYGKNRVVGNGPEGLKDLFRPIFK